MKRIKELRKEKRITQIAMQMATGIDQALLSKYESGERIPPTETLVAIADYFNVSTDYLLERTDNREINK